MNKRLHHSCPELFACAADLRRVGRISDQLAQGERNRLDALSEPDQISDTGREIADDAATIEAAAQMIREAALALEGITR